MVIFAADSYVLGAQLGKGGVTHQNGIVAALPPSRHPCHGSLLAPTSACTAVACHRGRSKRSAQGSKSSSSESSETPVSEDKAGSSNSDKAKTSRWAETVFKDTASQKERRGKAALDKVLVARQKGLGTLELLAGLALGPFAALTYPLLQKLAKEINDQSRELCVQVFSFRGCGTGAVPEALQGSFKSTVSLLFSFLLGYTFYSLFTRQEQLTKAMYAEVACLTQLLEEAQLYLPAEMCLDCVRLIKLYIAQGFWRNPTFLPAELMARNLRSDRDVLEQFKSLLVTNMSKIDCAYMLPTVNSLRAKQADTYAALQATVPFAQLLLLSFLGILCTLPPFFDGNGPGGNTGVTGVSQFVYGLLVEVVVVVLLVVQDAANPTSGFYSVEDLRGTLLSAMLEALETVEAKLSAQSETDMAEAKTNDATDKAST